MFSNTSSAHDFSLEESPGWYALQIRARFERRVSNRLLSRNCETFVPVARERRRWTDRYETVELPMFPGYVFVLAILKPADRLAILQSSGVFGFVTFNGSLARISDRLIGHLRRISDQNSSWSPYRYIASGPQVRIRSGDLDGVEGILALDKAGKKLVISIEPMQRSIAVSLEGLDFERV
ncbi:MAG: transcription termination/antitermination NusG family protein [Candidatus Korobacteraceae bacterium]